MNDFLRIDLAAILLEECFGMRENHARKVAQYRIEARCSKLEG